jgi:hypothetical protein
MGPTFSTPASTKWFRPNQTTAARMMISKGMPIRMILRSFLIGPLLYIERILN